MTYLLKGRHYKAIYTKLQEILNGEEIMLFAIPERKQAEQYWFASEKGYTFRKYNALSEEEKDYVSSQLEELRSGIVPKLLANNELSAATEELFKIPSEDAILLLDTSDGHQQVCLIQWGCLDARRNQNHNPLEKVINRPKPDHSKVTISAKYSDGEAYAGLPVIFEYKGRQRVLRTDKNGLLYLGSIKNGLSFSIAQEGEAPLPANQFTVQAGRELPYEVVFPYLLNFTIQVVDQFNEPVPQARIEAIYEGQSQYHVTDESGLVALSQVELKPSPFDIEATGQPDTRQSYELSRATEQLVFQIKRKQYANVLVKVIDEQDEVMSAYPLAFKHHEQQWAGQSDEQGLIHVGKLSIDAPLSITDAHDENNYLEATLNEGEQEIVVRVKRQVPNMIRVNLINHKNAPLPGIPMDFTIGSEQYQRQTDEEGCCFFEESLFSNKEKVKVQVHTKNKKGKEKIRKKSFTFKEEQNEYTIKLRKFNWWWLLLLLLLLLLIKCEKQVYVQVLNSENQNPVSNTEVQFSYHKYFLYDEGRFFTNDLDKRLEETDTFGIAQFANIEYSIYSLVFKLRSSALIYSNSSCIGSDTLTPWLHFIKNKDTLNLFVEPTLSPIDFKVVDKKDGEALPDALVKVRAEYLGKIYEDSATTDEAGRVVFDRIPGCGVISLARGSAEGYYPDEIKDQKVADLAGDVNEKRLLELEPIEKKLVFFVEDCKTRRRIPGAEVNIEISYGDGRKSTQKKRTNVNGVGKGEYDEVHIIADVTLIGSAPPYYKEAKLPTYKVGDFIKLPDASRTICLEPIPNLVEFKNIDSLTRKPIEGVKNTVTIKNGSDLRSQEVISNKKGKFAFPINPGDKVSIVSEYPPDYNKNATKIKNANGVKLIEGPASGRTIPLSPKMIDLVFRTVEEKNPSTIIPNANINVKVSIDGRSISIPTPKKSDSNGQFKVKVPITSEVSIVASKSGYGDNNSKVRNDAAKALASAPQSRRDIPP